MCVGPDRYEYPVTYKKTDPYDAILSDLPAEWSREANIREGTIQQGKGPDFPGDLGVEDESGVCVIYVAKTNLWF
jgi:hypothetical protein